MRVLHSIAGCLRKQDLHNHQPLLCVPAHSTPNKTWMGWPILSLELQNNSYWMSLTVEVSKGKLILKIWVTKLFGLVYTSRIIWFCWWSINAFFLSFQKKKKKSFTYTSISRAYAFCQLTDQLRPMYLYEHSSRWVIAHTYAYPHGMAPWGVLGELQHWVEDTEHKSVRQ